MSADSRKLALYPGTFDPVTNGHLSLVERAVGIFDEVVVAVARRTSSKSTMFTCDERVAMMQTAIAGLPHHTEVRVISFEGLTANLAVELGAVAIIRGMRAVSDFEYEFQMALMNRRMAHDVETVFLMPALSWVYLSSSMIKDVARHDGDIAGLVPDSIVDTIIAKVKAETR
ncbi:MAG: pantetheine-phosphate adenylyltransferase [candidate division Zixibacteria bacterium]|jgi:pantetheine-phosphate adenylyltransferase|nr:pantetheine-phosphate adenylyltransferase [candidate division Zixibacteria bacterium]